MSTTTRIVSPPAFAGAGAGAPHSNTQPRSRSQRTIGLEIDRISASGSTNANANASGSSGNTSSRSSSGGGASRSHIRQTTTSSSLPLTYFSLPPLTSTSRLRTYRTPSPLTTTQRPRPSQSPPPQNTQASPWGEPASASSTHIELPPIGSWENDHPESLHNADLENSLLASEIEDNFLADLADGDFSSPSSYPPFTNPDSRPSQSHSVSLHSTVQASTPHRAFRNTTASTNATTNTTARELSSTNCILHPFGPERTTTQLSSASNSAGESQASLPVFDSLEENDFFFDSPASSFSEAMPPATRRSTTAAAARTGSAHVSKRRRTSTTAAPAAPRPTSRQRKSPAARKDMDVEELFGTSPTRSPIDVEAKPEFDTIDLTETNEVFEEVRKPEKDDRVKLAAFQCVICMDDCSNLTVTHCGHLYCASCLHQSLHVDVTKGKCPMCRQRLEIKPRESYNSKTKGYWPLELKLMTATRKGKRKANTLS
ncbi:e3 ubiquitin ligase complex slx8-rfp subunit slx8 [Fusarium subglutinans]|uniref:E3 ubiquitin ligase complex slx8-rfp subunit slx8 n=1 Tax=Gibberella subglutinans TaxID=42677 RepID=A0A8H5Q5A8_GIBSU|nr:e3 ubiquitin ligase complex slx8-rfp subunit slx8 [Fusarium subglutinans]KAF5607746.1 e3 ubiquitin ligase complex slx8-rfp subunit slx8 [Fusarium subglutinans]